MAVLEGGNCTGKGMRGVLNLVREGVDYTAIFTAITEQNMLISTKYD
jgi:hypothetical protein